MRRDFDGFHHVSGKPLWILLYSSGGVLSDQDGSFHSYQDQRLLRQQSILSRTSSA